MFTGVLVEKSKQVIKMQRNYFGTDGIRGRVGTYPIKPDFFMRLGFAAGRVLGATHLPAGRDRPAVLVGKDTRISGYIFESALQAGLLAAGVDVFLSGPLSTPGVAFMTREMNFTAGAVISASHNSYEHNGIKFFEKNGRKLSDDTEQKIEEALEDEFVMEFSGQQALGKSKRASRCQEEYIYFCINSFPAGYSLKGINVVVDCANGATYNVAEKVFRGLGANVHLINADPNGFNINENCGSLYPKRLAVSVLKHKADLGIAFDGDGDRVVFVDGCGHVFDGDKLLYIIAKHRQSQNALKGGIVGTLMTNLGLENAFRKCNINFERTKVGDRYVLERLHSLGWDLGGESSGHIICLDKHSTGDGIVSALQVLASVVFSGHSLRALCADIKEVPQVLISEPVNPGYDFEQDADLSRARQEFRKAMGDSGRLILRASGTEDVVRIMVEGLDADFTKKAANSLAKIIRTSNR